MIRKLLIVNRGEIALRIVRACREMGIESVAVYSEVDRDSPHVSAADRAYCIGPAPATESYLNVERILETAHRSGADAIHPGYGFLAESATFAEACRAAKIKFVGPSPESIRALGDKIGAKTLMAAAGVPTVPGYLGGDQTDTAMDHAANKIGFPILIKASAGGGGRGMRVVDRPDMLIGELSEARREAKAGFGDDSLLLEHYVPNARHVEFQIFGDTEGNVIHLFERECSIQRRHQKIIEESPAPALTPELRARMANAAVRAGQAASYTNAGTVEFLVSGEEFFFLEVNTRLQVEHPVTEAVTGLDLVHMQLAVASGEPLLVRQEDVSQRGHAIEVRIYAEDPERGFAPSIGDLLHWTEPQGPGVRVDAGYRSGMAVPMYYDPMLAKLIVSAESRPAALARLDAALHDFNILGVHTIIPFLRDVVNDPEFAAGRYDTGFLGRHFAEWQPSDEVPEEVLLALAAAASVSLRATPGAVSVSGPWQSADDWRNAR